MRPGSLRPEVGPGSLVALSDHINTMPGTPMVGQTMIVMAIASSRWLMLMTQIIAPCFSPLR
ncbi:purine nucleoside phosphorylase [Salmonella enterica subsp. enterica]|uniref:Purine nucleoside phosphorylase n=1 Tax=Salmonella enterica I TaxID=59201 RepID=A0A379WQ39_SALET|nr:purine nucleoside phosphorylase [Salmonella enterica subsp. enterica]